MNKLKGSGKSMDSYRTLVITVSAELIVCFREL